MKLKKKKGTVAGYRFSTVWWTAAGTDRVWEVLANYATWSTWWRGIQSVEVLRDGDESGVGTILRQQWRSRVPYTLIFDLEMLRIESGKLLDGRASGDLEGACRWTFASGRRWDGAALRCRRPNRPVVDEPPYPVRIEGRAGELQDHHGLGARGAGADTWRTC
jgi:hypothetical protein